MFATLAPSPTRPHAHASVVAGMLALLAQCVEPEQQLPSCGEQLPNASLNVTGTYRYASPIYALRGTISFAQEGNRVLVTDTTYDNANDRPLSGAGELSGNRLDLQLTPKNGDTNYSADVSFLFDPASDGFCLLGFADTNGDRGAEGSYSGAKR